MSYFRSNDKQLNSLSDTYNLICENERKLHIVDKMRLDEGFRDFMKSLALAGIITLSAIGGASAGEQPISQLTGAVHDMTQQIEMPQGSTSDKRDVIMNMVRKIQDLAVKKDSAGVKQVVKDFCSTHHISPSDVQIQTIVGIAVSQAVQGNMFESKKI